MDHRREKINVKNHTKHGFLAHGLITHFMLTLFFFLNEKKNVKNVVQRLVVPNCEWSPINLLLLLLFCFGDGQFLLVHDPTKIPPSWHTSKIEHVNMAHFM
jgi:hypothetical protein